MKRLESVAIWLVIVTAFAAVTITLPFYFVAGYIGLIMEPRNNV